MTRAKNYALDEICVYILWYETQIVVGRLYEGQPKSVSGTSLCRFEQRTAHPSRALVKCHYILVT
jgi:hypothetical protein